MKKQLLTLALPLLLAGGLFLGMVQNTISPQPAPPPVAQKNTPQISPKVITDPQALQAYLDNARKKFEDTDQKLRDHAAKAYSRMTPQMERRLLDTVMRFREPRCRELFTRWNLDPETADSVIKIIEEREGEVMARRRDFLKAGVNGASDFSNHQNVNQALAEVQLTTLLGEARAAELRRLEKQLDAEYLARARSNARD
ncbi:hypothetical protein [Prosthecobacter sp.]|uniref:hypothetical protein n=1 Tax=Prosthecobacter sp. TaxID=1965333 RepID=UPI0037841B64